MDRIDLHITLHRPSPEFLLIKSSPNASYSSDLKHRVGLLQHHQTERQGCLNRELAGDALLKACQLKSSTERWLINAA